MNMRGDSMRLGSFYTKTYKSMPYDVQADSTQLLYRSGLVKLSEEGHMCYSPMGALYAKKLQNSITERLGDFMEFKVAGGESECMAMYQQELKSYKQLPLKLFHATVSRNDDYKFKEGLFNPRQLTSLAFTAFEEEQSAMDIRRELAKDLMGLGVELGVKLRHLDSEGVTSLVWESKIPLKRFLNCDSCGFGGDAAYIKSGAQKYEGSEELLAMEYIHTPSVGTIAQLEEFFGAPAKRFIKTLIFEAGEKIVAVLIRGDRNISTWLLAQHLGMEEAQIKMASEETVLKATGAGIGFAGPIGLKADLLLCDEEVLHMKNAVCGANRTDYHIKNVTCGRDFKPDAVGVFKEARPGDACPSDAGTLEALNGSEIASIEIKELKGTYLDENSREKRLWSVSARIYMERLMSAIAEENMDESGAIVWPAAFSPFEYCVIAGNVKKPEELELAEAAYRLIVESGRSALLDDRSERIGSKFIDCELLGVRGVVVAGKLASQGLVEVRDRKSGTSCEVALEELLDRLY